MHRNDAFWIIVIVLFLGVFFQYNRMDGFLHLFSVANTAISSVQRSDEPWSQADTVTPDTYIVIYDPSSVESMFLRHETERMLKEKKMRFQSIRHDQPITMNMSTIRGIILSTGELEKIVSLPAVFSYVEQGGTAVVLTRLSQSPDKPIRPDILSKLGVSRWDSRSSSATAFGLTMNTDFLAGSKGIQVEGDYHYETIVDSLLLSDDAVVHVSDNSGSIPLIWQKNYGKGTFYIYNGSARSDKTNRGFLMSFLAHCGDDVIYPVVGCKLFYIDDFPSPIPEGYHEKIRSEYNMTTRDFYSRVWWPYMKDISKSEHLKYTGVIIESYGDQVKGPFKPVDEQEGRNALLTYGTDLLYMGGELGIHGYNHQPLVPPGYQNDEPDYVPWQNEDDMEEALTEINRYVHEAFPKYKFRAYVPPSNILSPQGREAILESLPDIRILSSLYDGSAEKEAYYQEFQREENGVYDIPRITAGYNPTGLDLYFECTVITSIGVFNHFVHPDELFYEESKDKTWHMMKEGLQEFLKQIDSRYGWLTAVTASESLPYFDSYFNLDYRVLRKPDELEIHCWNYTHEASFLLRSTKEVASSKDCHVQKIGDEMYFVKITGPEAHIYWKGSSL